MMGVSPYMTRSDLLKLKATGIAPEVDEHTQARFDAGHAAEAAFRLVLEAELNTDFYPVTGSEEIDGLKLLASFDGLTMDGTIGYEHKLLNAKLAVYLIEHKDAPESHYWQLEQQLLVSGACYIHFVTSDGTIEHSQRIMYASHPERRTALIEGWAQFKRDLDEYVPAEYVAPAPIGRTPENLPALRIELTGAVTESNLAVYKETALAVFAGINRELTTDQHFSDAEKTVKWCGDIEERIKAAKRHALSQTESIDQLFRTMDEISTEARNVRLELDKLVKSRKDALRVEIVREADDALDAHVHSLNERLGKPYMPTVAPDFAGAIKGKKNFDSMRDAVSVVLANAKIAANAKADAIELNLKSLRELAKDHAFLFADTQQLVTTKANDDLVLLINSRIATHKAAEEKRLADEREKIRLEEVAKLEKEKADEAERETIRKDVAAAMEKRAAEAAFAAAQPKPEEAPEVVPQAAPVVASVSRQLSPVLEAPAFAPRSQLSDIAAEFLAAREWPTQAAKNTARAVLIEYETFCSLRVRVAA